MQASILMVPFAGQVPLHHSDREAFREVDHRALFGPLAKWAAEMDLAERVPQYLSRTFGVAWSGRPGPVVPAEGRPAPTAGSMGGSPPRRRRVRSRTLGAGSDRPR